MADKLWGFVQKLGARTVAGKVNWVRTAEDRVYQASFPNYTVRIFPRAGEMDAPDYVVQILDQEGATVEEASDVDLGKAAAGQETYRLMKDMYEFARRKAMGVDHALDTLMDALDRDPDAPF